MPAEIAVTYGMIVRRLGAGDLIPGLSLYVVGKGLEIRAGQTEGVVVQVGQDLRDLGYQAISQALDVHRVDLTQ